MEVQFSPEQEAELATLAERAGTDTAGYVKSLALEAVDEAARFRGAVRKGLEQAERGEFLKDEEVFAWLQQQKQREQDQC